MAAAIAVGVASMGGLNHSAIVPHNVPPPQRLPPYRASAKTSDRSPS